MNVLIDTNVLLSAALRDKLPERVLLYVAAREDFRWLVTPEILAEYRDVLRRPKFGLDEATRQHWAELLALRTVDVGSPPQVPNFSRDPKDAPFLAAALAAHADFLKPQPRASRAIFADWSKQNHSSFGEKPPNPPRKSPPPLEKMSETEKIARGARPRKIRCRRTTRRAYAPTLADDDGTPDPRRAYASTLAELPAWLLIASTADAAARRCSMRPNAARSSVFASHSIARRKQRGCHWQARSASGVAHTQARQTALARATQPFCSQLLRLPQLE